MKPEASHYTVVFRGRVLPGQDRGQVKARIAAIFKLDAAQADKLFDGRAHTVRRGLSLDQARRMEAAFGRAGALCELLFDKPATVPPAAEPRPAIAAPVRPRLDPATLVPARLALPRQPALRAFTRPLALTLAALPPALYGLLPLALLALALANLIAIPTATSVPAAVIADLLPALLQLGLAGLLLRPLWPRRGPPTGLPLEEGEDRLRGLVQALARRLDLAVPVRLELDCDVGFEVGRDRRGARLRLGIPLLQRLSAAELAGVIAHGLAHLAPAPGRGATLGLYRLLSALDRLARSPDRWQERLQAAAEAAMSPLPQRVLESSAVVLGLPRRLLGMSYRAARLLALPALAAAERAADQVQLQVAGSAGFAATQGQLRLLAFGRERAEMVSSLGWEDHWLPEDLPALMQRLIEDLAPADRSRVEATAVLPDGFDPHPADQRRLADAAAAGMEPGVRAGGPAALLVDELTTLARQATLVLHQARYGTALDAAHTTSAEELLERLEARRQGDAALKEYLHGFFLPWHFPAPGNLAAALALPRQECLDRLGERVSQVRRATPELRRVVEQLNHAHGELLRLQAAQSATGRTQPEVQKAQERYGILLRETQNLDELLQDRIALGLALAITAPGGPPLKGEVDRLLATQRSLTRLELPLQAARRQAEAVLQLVRGARPGSPPPPTLTEALRRECLQKLDTVHGLLAGTPSPFGHQASDLLARISTSLRPPPREAKPERLSAYINALDRWLGELNGRVLGRLAAIAEGAERAGGIRVKLVDAAPRRAARADLAGGRA